MIIKRVSNGQKINIDKLSLEELYQLHFEEEFYTARKMEKELPFSKERDKLLQKAYEIIEPFKIYEGQKESTNLKVGIYRKNFRAIFDRVVARMKPRELYNIVELGCGHCNFLNNISSKKKYKIYGCDIHASNIGSNITVKKENFYNFLKSFADNSIDVLVADNVCEHFMKDEADSIYNLIYQKLNPDGRIIFIIPNLYLGPNDISGKIKNHGKKPLGFHFMEQTYKDNIKLFKKHHLFTDYIALRLSEKRYLLIKNILGLDKIKIFLESILGKINFKRKRAAFTVLGLNTYILKKK